MSSGQNSGGLMSSAGLIRYFDEDSTDGIKINPSTILAVSAFIGVLLHVATATVA